MSSTPPDHETFEGIETPASRLSARGTTSAAVQSGCRCDETATASGSAGGSAGGSASGAGAVADTVPGSLVDRLTAWSDQHSRLLGFGLLAFVVVLTLLMLWHSSVRQRRNTPIDYRSLPAEIAFGGRTFPGDYFRGLEATRKTKNPDLVTEIRDVIVAGKAPAFVFGNTVPREHNVAASLREAFLTYTADTPSVVLLRQHLTPEPLVIAPQSFITLEPVLNALAPLLDALRQSLMSEGAAFEFVLLDSESGVYPDPNLPDYLRLFADATEYNVARAVAEERLTDALTFLAGTFRLCALASQLENVAIRYEVQSARQRAILALQATLLHAKAGRAEIEFGRRILAETREAYPSDAKLWSGDRASGMRVYDLAIRNGLEAALEDDEIDEIDDLVGLGKITLKLHRTIERDEVAYLQAMREVLGLCHKPYFERRDAVMAIENRIASIWESQQEAVIAYFLTRSLDSAMQTFAYDRSMIEVAFLALTLGLGESAESTPDPLAGKPYRIESKDGKAIVTDSERQCEFRVKIVK